MLAGTFSSSHDVPGPGHYTPNFETISSSSPKKKGPKLKKSSEKTGTHNTIIRDGLLVQLVGRNEFLGPGQYNVPLSTFGKKSFNERVNRSIAKSHEIR